MTRPINPGRESRQEGFTSRSRLGLDSLCDLSRCLRALRLVLPLV